MTSMITRLLVCCGLTAGILLFFPAARGAYAFDLTYQPPRTSHVPVTLLVALPSLACGSQGQRPNKCLLGGLLQAQSAAQINGPVRYICTIHYSYVNTDKATFNLSFSREEKTAAPDMQLSPGVGAPEKNRERTVVPDYGKPPVRTEKMRFKGVARQFGSVFMKDGKGEHDLKENAPVTLSTNGANFMLEGIECSQE